MTEKLGENKEVGEGFRYPDIAAKRKVLDEIDWEIGTLSTRITEAANRLSDLNALARVRRLEHSAYVRLCGEQQELKKTIAEATTKCTELKLRRTQVQRTPYGPADLSGTTAARVRVVEDAVRELTATLGSMRELMLDVSKKLDRLMESVSR